MIKSITVTNYLNKSILLELARPEKSGLIVRSVTGLGPVKANINMTQLSTVDGALYNSARVTERNIVLTLEFMQVGAETVEDVRQKTYRYFPLKKPITFTIETDNRTLKTTGYVESNEPNIFSDKEGCTISVLCPDPYLYSSEVAETVFSGIEPAFEFPFENLSATEPLLEFSRLKTKTEESVYYEGESEIGITIHIYAFGDVSNITIYNLTTNEQMRINTDRLMTQTGSALVAGDYIVIDTKQGHKGATLRRNGELINILNCIDRGSSWFKLTKGDNIFAYVVASGAGNLDFRIENHLIYEGV